MASGDFPALLSVIGRHDHQEAAGIVVKDTASALFGAEGLRVTDVQAGPGGALEVWAVTDYPAAAACPACGMISSRADRRRLDRQGKAPRRAEPAGARDRLRPVRPPGAAPPLRLLRLVRPARRHPRAHHAGQDHIPVGGRDHRGGDHRDHQRHLRKPEPPRQTLSTHTHLVVGDWLPDSYIKFLDHHNSWYMEHQRWKGEGVPYAWHSKINWPREFEDEIISTFEQLMKEHAALIGIIGGTEASSA
jgi:hypothetical protein